MRVPPTGLCSYQTWSISQLSRPLGLDQSSSSTPLTSQSIELSLCMCFSFTLQSNPFHPCPYPSTLMTTWPKPSMFPSSLHPAAINSAVRGKAPDPSPISSRALQTSSTRKQQCLKKPACPFHLHIMNMCPESPCHLLVIQTPWPQNRMLPKKKQWGCFCSENDPKRSKLVLVWYHPHCQ